MLIYHILHERELERIKQKGFYEPESYQKEGFIHCSTKEQVLPTANRRYFNQKDLLLLVIDTKKVDAKIVFEDTSGIGEKHPHIYGRLNWNAVSDVLKVEVEKNGSYAKSPDIIQT